ncbi:4-hydroxythreonine-4-phosphate dehydrogenase PdxA [Octadecabacter arcticus 238]|uniref:4-hydroxythreonine-4-phosphate dehydrogenase n=1 Tax=Octadecabacter arcticus 238 TaxID=391616 RepID=M9RJG8_9RHOB|nr:4-hydroxythreonine-4-phosphate dehydrogenase PdxA [Octadecabacter arcticus]AGI72342.1 4-hydroxythreonine-4-phosphate dehydrogenase PdxA [Octadecabacter arcticus 238]
MKPAPRPVAISCGEPAGIGPEIAVAAWNAVGKDIPLVWIGDPTHLPAGTNWQAVTSAADAITATAFPVLRRDFGAPNVAGRPNPTHAQGVIDSIADAVALVQSGDCAALCTAPIHKQALIDGAHFAYPGHTEYLAALAGRSSVVMMLASDMLRVVPATIHIPLAQVAVKLTAATLNDTILITHAALVRDFGIAKPRLAVAGLNPHAGEGGKFGCEEIEMITPTLDALRAEGLNITGPLSADTMFHPAARATYDVAICMYHDQALIPIKTLDFSGGVNITLGLPFVRTSPDHGTAFDIAGTDTADATSMIAAIRMAAGMAHARTAPQS